MKFIKSTDHMKNLLILSEVEKGLPMTQAILADIAGVSVAMVNSYIRKLCANVTVLPAHLVQDCRVR